MGLVVGVLLQLFGTSMRSVGLAQEYSFAVQVAESRLATIGTEIPVEQGNLSGEESGSGYRWHIAIEPFKLSDTLEALPLSAQIFRVVVTVTWGQGDKPREFQLSSLRFGKKQ